MKLLKISVLILTISCLSQNYVHGQYVQSKEQRLYMKKVERFQKMKRTGLTLMGIGAVTTVVSGILVSKGEFEYNPVTGQNEAQDSNATFGVLGLMVGIPAFGTGSVLTIIGNNKSKSYQRKLENVTAGYWKQGKCQGLSVAIRF